MSDEDDEAERALRPFAEHLAETKAMRKARTDEGRKQGHRDDTNEESNVGFNERDQVEGARFDTGKWTKADVKAEGANGGKDPSRDEIWLRGESRFMKLHTAQARRFAAADALPVEMRLWFAAADRVDSVGHAIFESGELEQIIGRDVQAIQRAIRRGKAGGLFEEMTNSRHVWLVGVEDGSGYGLGVAKARFIRGDGYPGPATGWEAA